MADHAAGRERDGEGCCLFGSVGARLCAYSFWIELELSASSEHQRALSFVVGIAFSFFSSLVRTTHSISSYVMKPEPSLST